MPNFLLAYHGGAMAETPAAQEAAMAAWGAWFGALGAAVVDGGNPVTQIKVVAPGGVVMDPTGERITGYSVLAADSLDAAIKMAEGCPVLKDGGAVQVCETVNAM